VGGLVEDSLAGGGDRAGHVLMVGRLVSRTREGVPFRHQDSVKALS
jgi:hypothetical protein